MTPTTLEEPIEHDGVTHYFMTSLDRFDVFGSSDTLHWYDHVQFDVPLRYAFWHISEVMLNTDDSMSRAWLREHAESLGIMVCFCGNDEDSPDRATCPACS